MIFNFDQIFKQFNLNFVDRGNYYAGTCPFHPDSDNPNAFLVFKNTGIIKCNTRGCEKQIGNRFVDFVNALSKKDGIKVKLTFPNKDPEKLEFIKKISLLKKPPGLNIKLEDYLTILEPAEYFLKQGFSEEILSKYYIGKHKLHGKPLSNRILVPILDLSKKRVLGVSGRIIYDKCMVCQGYHEMGKPCLQKHQVSFFPKWKHSPGFDKSQFLYNLWEARDYILECREIILLEGPGCCLKLEQCDIHNSLAIFGASLSNKQASIIKALNPKLIRVATDSDEAGWAAAEYIERKFKNICEVIRVEMPRKDVGEMSCEEIKEIFNDNARTVP